MHKKQQRAGPQKFRKCRAEAEQAHWSAAGRRRGFLRGASPGLGRGAPAADAPVFAHVTLTFREARVRKRNACCRVHESESNYSAINVRRFYVVGLTETRMANNSDLKSAVWMESGTYYALAFVLSL